MRAANCVCKDKWLCANLFFQHTLLCYFSIQGNFSQMQFSWIDTLEILAKSHASNLLISRKNENLNQFFGCCSWENWVEKISLTWKDKIKALLECLESFKFQGAQKRVINIPSWLKTDYGSTICELFCPQHKNRRQIFSKWGSTLLAGFWLMIFCSLSLQSPLSSLHAHSFETVHYYYWGE